MKALVTILDATPKSLVLLPTQLTVDEFTRLIQVPALENLILTGITDTYVRKLLRSTGVIATVRGAGLEGRHVLEKATNPRGDLTVEELEKELEFHLYRLNSLFADRRAVRTFNQRQQAQFEVPPPALAPIESPLPEEDDLVDFTGLLTSSSQWEEPSPEPPIHLPGFHVQRRDGSFEDPTKRPPRPEAKEPAATTKRRKPVPTRKSPPKKKGA